MFDIAWSEMLVIGAVALVVIGPKDLPKALRSVGEMVGKVRRMAGEFQSQFNDAMREAELHEIKKQVEEVGGSVQAATKVDFNPIQTIREELKTVGTGAAAGAVVAAGTTIADANSAQTSAQAPAPQVEPTVFLPDPPPPPDPREFLPAPPVAEVAPAVPTAPADVTVVQPSTRAAGGNT
jgi:sec-independent protein translocase protein TatB